MFKMVSLCKNSIFIEVLLKNARSSDEITCWCKGIWKGLRPVYEPLMYIVLNFNALFNMQVYKLQHFDKN